LPPVYARSVAESLDCRAVAFVKADAFRLAMPTPRASTRHAKTRPQSEMKIKNRQFSLPHSAIAMPLHGAHFAGDHFHFEWSVVPDALFSAVPNDGVFTRRQGDLKFSFGIGRE